MFISEKQKNISNISKPPLAHHIAIRHSEVKSVSSDQNLWNPTNKGFDNCSTVAGFRGKVDGNYIAAPCSPGGFRFTNLALCSYDIWDVFPSAQAILMVHADLLVPLVGSNLYLPYIGYTLSSLWFQPI